MFDHVAARLKQFRKARVLMKKKEWLEEVKRKQYGVAQRLPHDKMLKKITEMKV